MRFQKLFIFVIILMFLEISSYAQANCLAPELSNKQIEEIINRERILRSDLPKPFSNYRTSIHRQGCHYIYIEFGLPESPGANIVFKLNQHGVIVDVIPGESFKCTDNVLTEKQLSDIIQNERLKKPEFPNKFVNFKTKVIRLRCLYIYYEIALPESQGVYQTFTIDPYGEIIEFYKKIPLEDK